jgi:hypothetical protein
VALIVTQQPMRNELRNSPTATGAWGCHVQSFWAMGSLRVPALRSA